MIEKMHSSSTIVVEKRESYDVVIVGIYGNASGVMFRSYHTIVQNPTSNVISAIPHRRYLMNVHIAKVVRLCRDYQVRSDSNKVSRNYYPTLMYLG